MFKITASSREHFQQDLSFPFVVEIGANPFLLPPHSPPLPLSLGEAGRGVAV
jgi:hypothetical protein